MSTDFRALCAELHKAFEPHAETLEEERLLDRSAAALRAALAEPGSEPPAGAERPSDEELRDLWSWAAGQDQGPWPTQYHCFARAVLARWGQPHCGQPPAPAAEGEVAELAEALRGDLAEPWRGLHGETALTRAAELLERYALLRQDGEAKP